MGRRHGGEDFIAIMSGRLGVDGEKLVEQDVILPLNLILGFLFSLDPLALVFKVRMGPGSLIVQRSLDPGQPLLVHLMLLRVRGARLTLWLIFDVIRFRKSSFFII